MSDYIGGYAARVLLAVVNGARTVREIAERVGLAPSTAQGYLKALRVQGLVSWETDRDGTPRATVAVVSAEDRREIAWEAREDRARDAAGME